MALEWTRVITSGPPPEPKNSHAIASSNTHVFVFGGFTADSYLDSLHILHLRTPAPPNHQTIHLASRSPR